MDLAQNESIPMYNSRIIDTYTKLIKAKYADIDVSELLNHAGMKPYEVADQGHWFTQQQINRFYEKLVKMTNNEHIAHEAGRYAASPDAIGIMRQYVLARISPTLAYELIGKTSANFTRSAKYESRKLASNKVEIIVTPYEGITEELFQCQNRIGFFESILAMHNCRSQAIDHTECIFDGGTACKYTISWEMTPAARWKSVQIFSLPILLALVAIIYITGSWAPHGIVELAACVVFLALTLIAEVKEKNEIKTSLRSTTDAVDQLLEQTNLNYNNALMTNEIGQALNVVTNTGDILNNVVHIMQKRLNYDRGLILLANADMTRLEIKTGYGYDNSLIDQLDNVSFNLDRPESRGTFVVSFREQKPILINDINELEDVLSRHSMAFARKFGIQSFICCPIVCEGESLGVLAVDNLASKKPLVQSDMSLLMGIASVIGISLRNAELMEARVRQFNSVLHVLAVSIDARDTLTADHSEKVTEYAMGICNELGLSWDYCEMIRVAALLHDYGKIGVEDSILKNAGALTDAEYETVKTHATKTREILSRINFEGIYREVPEIAGSHHERIDGSGYPQGLKGDQIPLGAKIIGVADYFDAITSKRHYREPMELEDAFATLRGEIGRYFDKDIVEALIRHYSAQHVSTSSEGPSPSASKQRASRFPVQTEVMVRCGAEVMPGISMDICANGLYIAADVTVTEGMPIEFSITLPGHSTGKIEAAGKVAWVNSSDQPRKPDFPTGFGVEILDFQKVMKELFQSFVDSCTLDSYPHEIEEPAFLEF